MRHCLFIVINKIINYTFIFNQKNQTNHYALLKTYLIVLGSSDGGFRG